tara:strand:- start:436 stop:648 length:213 start_codon:yes stop_codon:yes gene_type:complete
MLILGQIDKKQVKSTLFDKKKIFKKLKNFYIKSKILTQFYYSLTQVKNFFCVREYKIVQKYKKANEIKDN